MVFFRHEGNELFWFPSSLQGFESLLEIFGRASLIMNDLLGNKFGWYRSIEKVRR